MELFKNPFYVLGANSYDNRKRIMELAEDRSLTQDPEACAAARSDLLNPRKRLTAEVAWLPGVDPQHGEKLLSILENSPSTLLQSDNLPPMAWANLLVAGLFHLPEYTTALVENWVAKIAEVFEAIDAEELIVTLNKARCAAGFPEISDNLALEDEIQEQKRLYCHVIMAVLDKLSNEDMLAVVTALADKTTSSGKSSAPVLIDELIDLYQLKVQPSVEEAETKIKELAEQIYKSMDTNQSDSALTYLTDNLIGKVKLWNKFALPIQIIMKSRGIKYKSAHNISQIVFGLSINISEKNKSTLAKNIMEMLYDVFSKFDDEIDYDVIAKFIEINGLASDIISDVNISASASSLQSKVSQICQLIKNWKSENNVIDIGIASIIREIAILIQKKCNADEMSLQIVNTLYDKFSYIDIIRKQLNKDRDVLLKNIRYKKTEYPSNGKKQYNEENSSKFPFPMILVIACIAFIIYIANSPSPNKQYNYNDSYSYRTQRETTYNPYYPKPSYDYNPQRETTNNSYYSKPSYDVTENNTEPETRAPQDSAPLSTNKSRLSDSAFLELCKRGTSEEVREAIVNGANLNAKDRTNIGALMFAAGDNPNPEVVKVLIAAGAKVNSSNKNNWTPLMLAAGYNSNPQVVQVLLDAGANIHAKTNRGTTALLAAAQHSPNPEVVTMLIKAGADVNAQNSKGQNALWCARHSKREKISAYRSAVVDQEIETLLQQAGARAPAKSINAMRETPPMNGFTLGASKEQFIALCRKGTTEAIRRALAEGANANAENDLNWTALMEASMHNPRAGVITVLLNAGAAVNAQDDNGWSALMVAAKHNPNPEVVATLLRAGADVNARNNRGDTPLSCARNPGSLRTRVIKNSAARRAVNVKIEELILRAGAQTYSLPAQASGTARERSSVQRPVTFSPETQFIALCRTGTPETIYGALVKGANVNAKNELGWTALMETAMHNPREEAVRMLLVAGAEVNAQDANGWSALMVAALHNPNPEVVAALLQANADVTAINSKGKNALWCARNPGVLRTKAIPNMAKRHVVNEKIVQLIEGRLR